MSSSLRSTFDLRRWKPFEIVWMIAFPLVGTVVTIVTKDTALNFAILVTGILCVVFAAKGNIWNYLFGLVNSFGYAYVAFANGFYGDMGLNLLFFVPTNVIGFFMWKDHLSSEAVEMRGLSLRHQILIGAATAATTAALGYVLSLIKTEHTPYIDSTSTVLSVVATLLMMWRYKEQWLLYIILNAVTVVMWVIRGLHGSHDALMMVTMWTAFLLNAVYGYLNWRTGALESAMPEPAQ